MVATSDRLAHDLQRAWWVVGMTVVFMMINFADKVVVGLAAQPIMKDLHLTNEQFGEIGSAFFLLFSIAAAVVGFVVNRISTKLVLGVMAFVWALTLMPMVGLASVTALVASRVVLGAAEGPAYPVALHAVYKWFPQDRRAFPTSLISIGAAIGVGLAMPLLSWIIRTYDWHVAFGFLGVIGFIWVAVWVTVGREGPLDAHQVEAGARGLDHVPYLSLLTSRTFVGVTLSGFAAYWALALSVVWLPSFLIKAGGYSPYATGWILVLPPLTQIILSPLIGLVSQRLSAAGVASRIAQGVVATGCVTISGITMILLAKSTGEFAQVPLVMFSFALCSVTYALGPPLVGEISPVHQRGAMLGINNGLFSTAGLIAPWLMGHIVDVGTNTAQGFRDGFMLAGVLIIAGGVIAMLLISPAADLARFQRQKAGAGGLELPVH